MLKEINEARQLFIQLHNRTPKIVIVDSKKLRELLQGFQDSKPITNKSSSDDLDNALITMSEDELCKWVNSQPMFTVYGMVLKSGHTTSIEVK